MNKALVIAGKEIRVSFVTPLAYITFAGFMILSGFFFFSLLQQFNTMVHQASMMQDTKGNLNEWVIEPFFQTLQLVLVFLVPILTMRAFAEEKRLGTFELLLTSPISVAELVWGKFLGFSFVVVTMLLVSFVFPLALILFADPEVPPLFVGFFGLVMFSLGCTSIGIAVSSFTSNQTVSGVVSLVVLLVLYVIDAPAAKIGGWVADVLHYCSPLTHSGLLLSGVIESSSVVYFASLVLIGLFVSNRALDAVRYR